VPDLYAEFGRIIRVARTRASLSQADLGRAVGLSRASVANIEAGRQHVALDQLFDFAQALNYEPIELLPSFTSGQVNSRIPGLDKEVERHGLDPRMTAVLAEIMSRALEESIGPKSS
jgi:transcriptional regulator with XRE-family HTH domain